MLGRMAAVGFRTARGALRYREPSDDGPVEGRTRFWFAVPDRWRVEDDAGPTHIHDGEWVYIRDPDGRMQRMPQQTTTWSFRSGHPQALFGANHDRILRFTDPTDFSVPTGPAVAVEIAARRCWEFTLAPPPRKPHPLRVALDDATGTVLRMSVLELDAVTEAEEFEPDVPVPDELFRFDGDVATEWLEERVMDTTVRQWLESRTLPVPRYWPAGLPYSPVEGDPDTGSFSTDLEVPGLPALARWPAGGEPPRHWEARTQGRHVHRWRTGDWQWELAVETPLSGEDLTRVIESIPPDE